MRNVIGTMFERANVISRWRRVTFSRPSSQRFTALNVFISALLLHLYAYKRINMHGILRVGGTFECHSPRFLRRADSLNILVPFPRTATLLPSRRSPPIGLCSAPHISTYLMASIRISSEVRNTNLVLCDSARKPPPAPTSNEPEGPAQHTLFCYNSVVAATNSILPVRRTSSRGVAQPGRAPGSGPGGRRFKSSLPDQSSQSRLSY